MHETFAICTPSKELYFDTLGVYINSILVILFGFSFWWSASGDLALLLSFVIDATIYICNAFGAYVFMYTDLIDGKLGFL